MSSELQPLSIEHILRDERVNPYVRNYIINNALHPRFDSAQSHIMGTKYFIPVENPSTDRQEFKETDSYMILTSIRMLTPLRRGDTVLIEKQLPVGINPNYPHIAVFITGEHPNSRSTMVAEISETELAILRAFRGQSTLNITEALQAEADLQTSPDTLKQQAENIGSIYTAWLQRLKQCGYKVDETILIDDGEDVILTLPVPYIQERRVWKTNIEQTISKGIQKLRMGNMQHNTSIRLPDSTIAQDVHQSVIEYATQLHQDNRHIEDLAQTLQLNVNHPLDRALIMGISRNGIGVDGYTIPHDRGNKNKKRISYINKTVRPLGKEFRIIRGVGIAFVPITLSSDEAREMSIKPLLSDWATGLLENELLEEIVVNPSAETPLSLSVSTEDIYISQLRLKDGESDDRLPGVDGKKDQPFLLIRTLESGEEVQTVVFLSQNETIVLRSLLENNGYFDSNLVALSSSRITNAIVGINKKFQDTGLVDDKAALMVRHKIREFFTLFGEYTRRSDFLLRKIEQYERDINLVYIAQGNIHDIDIKLLDADELNTSESLLKRGLRGRHATNQSAAIAIFSFTNNGGETQRIAIDIAPGVEKALMATFLEGNTSVVNLEQLTKNGLGKTSVDRYYIQEALDHIKTVLKETGISVNDDTGLSLYSESGKRIVGFSFPQIIP